jgi:hypothetical protein
LQSDLLGAVFFFVFRLLESHHLSLSHSFFHFPCLSLVRRQLQLLLLLLPRSSSFLNSPFSERLSVVECTGRWGRGSSKTLIPSNPKPPSWLLQQARLK